MKKAIAALLLALLLAVALLLGLSSSGFRLFGVGVSWNPERAYLEQLAYGFLEDLQYKDFKRAARYHTWQDQRKADIPRLIERMFAVKPEQLNIQHLKITRTTFDRGGRRARTFFKCTLETLNTAQNPKEGEKNREREVEGILYWHKLPAAEALPRPEELAKGEASPPASLQADRPGDEQWFLMLESSLH
ncbi:MAG: hypothetical protein D6731_21820 [Planctomycetota bacterium]|nr:MAG: hypothetical protein D6731_21820 [Planctomycetota bacterium]